MSIEDLVEEAAARGAARALAASRVPRLAYSVPEAAEALGCSPDSVRRLVRSGRLPLVPGMGTRQLVPVAALEAFVVRSEPVVAAEGAEDVEDLFGER